MQFVKDLHDLSARFGVQVSGRFVRKEQGRSGGHGAGDGDALLLSAGKLVRKVFSAGGKIHTGKCFGDTFTPLPQAKALIDHGKLYVLLRTEGGDEVEILEHEPNFPVAHMRQFAGRIPFDRQTIQKIGPFIRKIKASDDVHHRGFSASGRTDDADEFPALDVQIYVIQRTKRFLTHMIDF